MKKILLFSIVFVVLMITNTQVKAQGYIEASISFGDGSSKFPFTPMSTVVNGETYIVGCAGGPITSFPITMGGSINGNNDVTITKLDASMNIVWSRFLGGSGTLDIPRDIVFSNGSLFIVGTTNSSDFPTTDGSTLATSGSFLVKINSTTGTLGFSTVFDDFAHEVDAAGGYIYTGGILNDDFSIRKYSASTGTLIFQKSIGGTDSESFRMIFGGSAPSSPLPGTAPLPAPVMLRNSVKDIFKADDNAIYFSGGYSGSTDFPVTNGSSNTSAVNTNVYFKLNAANGDIDFATYLGPTNTPEFVTSIFTDNASNVYLAGFTNRATFSTTDGSVHKGGSDIFLMKYNSQSNLIWSKLIGGNGSDIPTKGVVENGILYLYSSSSSTSGFPITTGATAAKATDAVLTKINAASGAILYSSFFGGVSAEMPSNIAVKDGNAYLYGATPSTDYPVTNRSVSQGDYDMYVTKINANNKICFSTYIGSANTEVAREIFVDGNKVYISGATAGVSYPSTLPTPIGHYTATKFDFGSVTNTAADVVTPSTQSVCTNGVVTELDGSNGSLSATGVPIIYRNGVAEQQDVISTTYQWQEASASSGPWTNIVGATQENYKPSSSTTNKYYRRLTLAGPCDLGTIVSTSTVAEVIVSTELAPTVDGGGPFNTCPGGTVTLGGSPTATAAVGATISSYQWEPVGTFTTSTNIANPSAAPTESTIYIVTVTDSKGCKQIGQTQVNVYSADAGPATTPACGSNILQIGTAPIAGLSGVTYNWTSVSGDGVDKLSCTNCAQPFVSGITQSTTYRLKLIIPKAGGGVCETQDDITINPVAGPTTSFGAPDVVVCSGSTATIGNPAEAGFTYTWAPGNYLTANNTAQTTFQPGSLNLPSPNPFTYYITALKDGCTFVDEVKATVLKVDAGIDGCGPRIVGTQDWHPNLPVTYLWEKLTNGPGTADFTGPTNTATTTISASTVVTELRLTISYGGITCSDNVLTGPCECLNFAIGTQSPNSCASYDLNGGDVTLKVVYPSSTVVPPGVVYSWTPQAGLNTYSGTTVKLTDNVPRTYTVTAYYPDGTSCSQSKSVNLPAWSLPVFSAQDVSTCPGTAVSIGQAPVSQYSYLWSPADKLISGTIPASTSPQTESNPKAVVNTTTNFAVLVTDVLSGCTITDIATVTIEGFPPNPAGEDRTFCGTANDVQLGIAPVSGVNYSWTPATTYNPSSTVANPKVDVAATTTYTLNMINTITGCTLQDDVTITIKPSVAPFSFTNSSFCPSATGPLPLPSGPTAPSGETYYYAWWPGNLVVNPSSNTTATTLATLPQTATTYTLTVTNNSGCVQKANYTIEPTQSLPEAGGDAVVCKNTGLIQLGNAGDGISTYTWSGTPSTAGLSATNIPNPTFNPTTAGTYIFTVSKTTAGCTTQDAVTIIVNEFVLPPINSVTACQNSCVTIGFDPSLAQVGASYTWTPAAGLSNTSITNPLACVSTSNQNYTIWGIGVNGCSDNATISVTVNPSSAPVVSIDPLTICVGSTGVTLNPGVSPAGTYNYLWSPNDGTLNNIYIKDPVVQATTAGSRTYTLTVTNTATGCSNTGSVNVLVKNCQQLGDRVWRDDNGNGTQENGEPGVAGVTVSIYKGGILIGSTITDAYGYYLFNGLDVGNDYVVKFTPPANYRFTLQGVGTSTGGSGTDSDANQNTGLTNTLTLAAGQTQLMIDAGLIPTVAPATSSIGDKVWMDTDGDGTQDSGEPGVAGVTVTLYSSTGTIIATTTTDAAGNYLFNNLPNGSYVVGVTPLPGTTFTSSTGTTPGNTTTNSDVSATAGASFGKTSTITISAEGTQITGIDAGLIVDPKSSLGDKVWYDVDQDGIQDATEVGIAGVTMTLLKETSPGTYTSIATTVTNAFGEYIFAGLDAGNYKVQATVPSGYTVTTSGTAGTGSFTEYNNSDFTPAGLVATTTSPIYRLAANQDYAGIDLGLYKAGTLGSIGDKVWSDTDGDGVQDAGEVGLEGITVTLYASDGTTVIATTATDGSGNYLFPGLAAGTYVVGFSNLPPNTQLSPTGAGTLSTDSDPNPATGKTGSIALAAGQNITTVDAGVVPYISSGKGSIGDYVWFDADNDGLQDTNETGVAGVTVTLYSSTGTTVLATTTTDAQGYYLFPNLDAGSYVVGFSNFPAGYALQAGKQNIGSSDIVDSDPDPVSGKTTVINLAQGQENLSVDAGIYNPSATNSIGDKVWLDANGDGVQQALEVGVPGVTVNLLDDNGKIISSVVTDANGNYFFGNLPNGNYQMQVTAPQGMSFTAPGQGTEATDSDVSLTEGKSSLITLTGGTNRTDIDAGLVTTKAMLGDKVWYDVDADGVQDAGEAGVAGVLVTLYASDGTTVITSTITDANGNYLFTNLVPDTYIVGFSNYPSGLVFTSKNATGSTVDSDVNTATGKTDAVTLTAGQIKLDVDAGLKPRLLGAITGQVWSDGVGGDALQGATDALVPGVTVTLKDGSGNVIGVTVTDGNGTYLFTNLPAGTGYTVTFSNYPGSLVPQNTTNIASGSDPNPTTGVTGSITVFAGLTTTDIDAGVTLYQAVPVSILTFSAVAQNRQVLVSWEVANELNLSKYEVEFSTDGISFVKIGDVSATNSRNYSFTHTKPVMGINYYRLKAVDVDGKFTYTEIRKVLFTADITIQVAPNPAVDYLRVIITSMSGVMEAKMYNASGQLVLKQEVVNGTNTMNVATFPGGLYTLIITDAKGIRISRHRIVIE